MKTPHASFLPPRIFLLVLAVLAPAFISCTPTVRLDTPEPVKIDVNMKVEVTTKNDGTVVAKGSSEEISPRLRQRNRITEIQSLKNDRLVGEGKDGLLHIQKLPPDPAYQEYTKKLVDAENADRKQNYQIEADAQNKPMSFIVSEYSRRLRESAYAGEWIQQDDGKWSQR